jgi:lysophospholipid acyltransferase (LPLAT)-like uncharacterized protein
MQLDPLFWRPYARKFFQKLDFFLYLTLKGWKKTLNFDDSFWYQIEKERPVLIALYHGELLPLVLYGAFREKLATVVSLHGDGEIIARVLKRLGFYTIRGSRDEGRYKGGAKALREILKALKENYHIAITVDGPKGPRGKVKPGILYAAYYSQRPIYPVRVKVKGTSLPTWDNFLVPYPFAEIEIKLGEPFWVKDLENLRRKAEELEGILKELEKE